jgi:hypothetical protein
MTMTPENETKYNKALRTATLKHGALTSRTDQSYGWIADDYMHKYECRLTSDQVPQESQWTEFSDSFTEHHPTKHGVDLKGVNCVCGQIVDRTVRWEANPAEMIKAVFEEAFNK